jgi:aminoglycoside/choline kinase family phosphotransferase
MSISVEPIEKGGSGRKFWRLRAGPESCIVVRYTLERADNAGYAAIAQFLERVGVRVPHVFFHDAAEGILMMEDAGTEDLWAFRDAGREQRRSLYERTLDQAVILHTRAHAAEGRPRLQPPFDEELYRWERDYFIEHCLGRHFQIPAADASAHVDHARLDAIGAQLAAAQPRCLVHRDFQSQNVMIHDGRPCLIDFQGLREGLAQYDLASLLLDPYAQLPRAGQTELFDYYVTAAKPADPAQFRELYDLCAMQRLMQALGAYGKLGHADGRADFLRHIPAAVGALREVVARIPGLGKLESLLGRL